MFHSRECAARRSSARLLEVVWLWRSYLRKRGPGHGYYSEIGFM